MKIKSFINNEHKEQLEKLLFFNRFQRRYLNEIDVSIKRFGLPRIIDSQKGLYVDIENLKDAQTLFVLNESDEILIGVMIFFRENISTITLLHIALNEEFITSSNKNETIVIKLISELLRIAKSIKGVKFLKVLYSSQFKLLKVR